ncbi:hypothetical protein F5144DRAFT_551277 [Chaetomium tenue]|uniref:Uncharacterized protein n=1 Tax=Chaetomium tenue TaxID=1854479 RepID=A0ACB7P575_9PEZI|nr:hypothetical protein F5144DRAFT_551277 [Chaetomium globosum]
MSKLPPALSVSYVNTKKDDGPQGSGGPPPKPLRWQMPISDRGENEAVWTNIREAFDPNLGYHSGPEKTSKSDLLARWVTHRSDRGENWAVRRNIRKAFDRYHSGPEKTSRGGLFGRWVMYISDRGEKWAVRTNIRNAFHSEFSYHSTESLSDIYDAEFKNQTANVIARHESDLLAKATTICTTSPFKPLALACYERTLENKIFTDPAAPKPAHDEDLTDARVRHGRLLVHVGERARQPGDAYRQAPDGSSGPLPGILDPLRQFHNEKHRGDRNSVLAREIFALLQLLGDMASIGGSLGGLLDVHPAAAWWNGHEHLAASTAGTTS